MKKTLITLLASATLSASAQLDLAVPKDFQQVVNSYAGGTNYPTNLFNAGVALRDDTTNYVGRPQVNYRGAAFAAYAAAVNGQTPQANTILDEGIPDVRIRAHWRARLLYEIGATAALRTHLETQADAGNLRPVTIMNVARQYGRWSIASNLVTRLPSITATTSQDVISIQKFIFVTDTQRFTDADAHLDFIEMIYGKMGTNTVHEAKLRGFLRLEWSRVRDKNEVQRTAPAIASAATESQRDWERFYALGYSLPPRSTYWGDRLRQFPNTVSDFMALQLE